MNSSLSLKELELDLKTDFASAIMDSFDGQIALVSNEGFILTTNEAWELYTEQNGGKRGQSKGSNYFEICKKATDEDSIYSMKALQGCMNVIDKKIPKFEMEYPCNGLEEKSWFLMKVIPFKHALGGIIISHENISEKINAQEKIDESEKRFMQLADTTPVLIWMTNETHKIVYVNQKLIAYTGKTREKIVNSSILKQIHPFDAKIIKPLIEKNDIKTFETIIRLKHFSHEYRFVLFNASPRFTKNGNFIGFIGTMVDITELLNTKTALENTLKTVSNYKYALDQFALISITDTKGTITEVNDKFCLVSKFSKSELIGCKHGILNSDFHGVDFFSEMKQTVHAGQVWRGEILNKAKDGSLFWVDASVVPLESTGSSKQFLSIYYEITDKKKAELELVKANNLISQASEIAKIGGWEYDILTETPEYSEQMYDFYGLPFGTKMTQDLWIEPFLPQDREKIFYNVAKCIEEGKEWKEEFLFKNFKGKTLWIQSVGKKIINKDQFPKLIGIFKDITEQKDLELQIIQKNDLLKESGKLSRLGGWSFDLKTNQITWTDMIYEIYGISKETEITPEIVMKPFLEHDQKLLKEGNEKSIQTGEAYEYKMQFRNFNNELLWTKNIGKCIFVNGEPTRLIGVFQDITKQKELDEERNKLLEDLMNKNKNLSQFTYIVSHNLRSPVANILGLTNLMAQQLQDPQMQVMVNHLIKSAKNLDGTFKDLNEILSLKEVSVEKSDISLDEIFRSITSSLVNQIEEANVEFNIDFSEINHVFTIKIYLHSILYNLISNAIKYRSPKRPLKIEIKTHLQKDIWILSVKDNGLGINMERNKDKIFGLYKRFHQHVEGKGIGLYLIKTQAEAMGGHVKVFSELEKGTEFLIYLPNEFK